MFILTTHAGIPSLFVVESSILPEKTQLLLHN